MPLKSLFQVSDEQLMWRVKLAGDPAAFASLLERWEKPIQNLCTRMTCDVHGGEDLAQETFVRVFARREEWQPLGKFSTFLWRVALNLCHDQLRRSKRRGECSLEVLDGPSGQGLDMLAAAEPAPDAQAEGRERAEIVRRALSQLPPPYREVVVLRHYQGLKFHEIADVLGIPDGTVKSRMAEALSQLGRALNHLTEDQICNRQTKTRELMTL